MTSIDVTTPRNTQEWRPAIAAGLQLGPARWNGEQLLTDASVAGQQRIIRIGLRERLILDQVNSRRTVAEIGDALAEEGAAVSVDVVGAALNRFLVFGLLERPFSLSTQTLTRFDARAESPANNLAEVWTAGPTRNDSIAPLRALASWPVFALAAIAGVTLAVFATIAIPTAIDTIVGAASGWLVLLTLLIAVIANFVVTLAHEAAHMSTFRALSNRPARLSVTRLGVVPMLNTQLDGASLLPASRKFRVVASGPIVSLLALGIPLAIVAVAPAGSFLELIGAISLLFDLGIVALALSFFPNTDGTRMIEALSSVDQLQAVAFRTLFGRYRLPRGLPFASKLAVRVYPVLLAATVIAVLLVGVFATRQVLS